MTVAVAPVLGLAAGNGVGDGLKVGFGGGTFHVEKELVAHAYKSLQTHAIDIVIAYVLHGAVGHVNLHIIHAAHEKFSFTVLVPVVGHEVVLLVGCGTKVWSHINPP